MPLLHVPLLLIYFLLFYYVNDNSEWNSLYLWTKIFSKICKHPEIGHKFAFFQAKKHLPSAKCIVKSVELLFLTSQELEKARSEFPCLTTSWSTGLNKCSWTRQDLIMISLPYHRNSDWQTFEVDWKCPVHRPMSHILLV